MKKITGLIFLLLFILLFAKVSYAQTSHELFIPPPTYAISYLNNQIMADSNANGTRKDPDRVYVLQRDGIYYINAQMRNTGWVMRVKAQDGPGKKPILFVIRNVTTGATPGRIFDLRGNLWIKNLILDGYFEYDPSTLGNLQGVLISTSATGCSIVADSCIFSNINGNHIRTDSYAKSIRVTNTIFANMGHLGTSNFGAGKGIDLRAGSIDTLLLVNNTFVNALDRIVRHYGSTANIKYLKFDHNTLVNVMSFHGTLSLGKVGGKVEITINMFYDSFAGGNDTDRVRQLEFSDSKEYDLRGQPRMTWVIAEPNDTTRWTISKNYYAVSTAGQAWFDKWRSAGVTGEGAPLTWKINKRLGADSVRAFTKVNIAMTNVPTLFTRMMDWYRDINGGNKTKNTPTAKWNSSYDYDRRGWQYYTDTLRCTYSTASPAYMGGDKGFPAGDLNWYPTLLNLWKSGGAVGITESNIVPLNYALEQNYPNPFNPTTNISYSLPKATNVTVKVFNSIGQEIALLVNNEMQNAGTHKISWNGKNAAGRTVATGVYFYQMQTNEVSMTRKMLLLK